MSHEATKGQEMTEMPPVATPFWTKIPLSDHKQKASYVKLLDSKDTASAKSSNTRTWPRLHDSLRPFRLQFVSLVVGYLARWKSSTEYRKVAMYRSRQMAALHSMLHFIPLCGAITVLALQWSKYWVGTESNDATLLQFVAKFHELTMQASLVEVLLCVIRAEAVDGYVPLGALSGATQPTLLSYLWSLDFISIFKSPALPRWRRAALVFIIPVIVILTSLVGPSSAILMIPRPSGPHVDREYTMYARTPFDTFYPSFMTPGLDLQRYNTTTLRRTYELQANDTNTTTQRRTYELQANDTDHGKNYSSKLMVNDIDTRTPYLECGQRRSLQSSLERSPRYDITIAMLPTCFIAYSYSWLTIPVDKRNRTTSVVAVHPVVSTRCTLFSQEAEYDTDTGNDTQISYYHDNGTSTGILFDFNTLSELLSNSSSPRNATIQSLKVNAANAQKVDQNAQNPNLYATREAYYPPIWIASPEPGSNSLIGVFLYWRDPPWQSRSVSDAIIDFKSNMTAEFRVKVCTTITYWNTGEIQLIEEMGTSTAHAVRLPRTKPNNTRSIALNIVNNPAMQEPKFIRDLLSINTPIGGDIGFTLTEALAITISEVPDVREVNLLRPELPAPENWARQNMSAFNFTTFVNGYGYGSTTISVRLAMAVIMAYCVVTITYIAYILVTGSTSTAWNSGIEIVALALQSRKPHHLGNAGVGIESIKTFQQGVGIRVNQDDELELVFARDRDIEMKGLRKIKRNKEY